MYFGTTAAMKRDAMASLKTSEIAAPSQLPLFLFILYSFRFIEPFLVRFLIHFYFLNSHQFIFFVLKHPALGTSLTTHDSSVIFFGSSAFTIESSHLK